MPDKKWKYGDNKAVICMVYELIDFITPSDESVTQLQDIIDEVFGRKK